KESGAAGVILRGNSIQIIYGPQVSLIKDGLETYLEKNSRNIVKETKNNDSFILYNMVEGHILDINECSDKMFSQKTLGDGIIIVPEKNRIYSPCHATVSFIFPTYHAIGLKLENGIELLLHFGINTVALRGKGFHVYVEMGEKIKQGDLIWEVDLDYIKSQKLEPDLIVVITSMPNNITLTKYYGYKNVGDKIMLLE
ncbi:MAG: glucose PTS transporter subunit IIA, partial [Faecalibacillus sp.]